MSPDRPARRADSCPWCGDGIDEAHDPVVVSPDRRQVPDQVLHRECATEWETFFERARTVASRGARHSLLDAPLERGAEVDDLRGDGSP